MVQNCSKNNNLRLVFAIGIAVRVLAYVVAMTIPMISYTRTEPQEVAGQQDEVTLMQFLWFTYEYPDLTGDILPDTYKAEVGTKFAITNVMYFPFISFVFAFVALGMILAFHKAWWGILFPLSNAVFALGGFLISPLFTLSIVNPAARLIPIILSAVTMVLCLAYLVLISIPQLRHEIATRERV